MTPGLVSENVRVTGSAVCTLPSWPHCQATTVTRIGSRAFFGMAVKRSSSPTISAGPSRTKKRTFSPASLVACRVRLLFWPMS